MSGLSAADLTLRPACWGLSPSRKRSWLRGRGSSHGARGQLRGGGWPHPRLRPLPCDCGVRPCSGPRCSSQSPALNSWMEWMMAPTARPRQSSSPGPGNSSFRARSRPAGIIGATGDRARPPEDLPSEIVDFVLKNLGGPGEGGAGPREEPSPPAPPLANAASPQGLPPNPADPTRIACLALDPRVPGIEPGPP